MERLDSDMQALLSELKQAGTPPVSNVDLVPILDLTEDEVTVLTERAQELGWIMHMGFSEVVTIEALESSEEGGWVIMPNGLQALAQQGG